MTPPTDDTATESGSAGSELDPVSEEAINEDKPSDDGSVAG